MSSVKEVEFFTTTKFHETFFQTYYFNMKNITTNNNWSIGDGKQLTRVCRSRLQIRFPVHPTLIIINENTQNEKQILRKSENFKSSKINVHPKSLKFLDTFLIQHSPILCLRLNNCFYRQKSFLVLLIMI